MAKAEKLTFLHFNDVYNLEESNETEHCGGVPRFLTAVKERMAECDGKALLLFSGDVFSPSPISTAVRGKQMVECLNLLGVKASVLGNHDFDFGIPQLQLLMKRTNFPWLMTNCFDVETGAPLAGAEKHIIMEWQGWKIGLMGIVEKEWLDTLGCTSADEIIYKDYVEAAKEASQELREQGAELIVCLAHMRDHNDNRLAREAQGYLDLILGGHDHHYVVSHFGALPVVKSGTEFRHLSVITLDMPKRAAAVKAGAALAKAELDSNPGWKGSSEALSFSYIHVNNVVIDTRIARDPEGEALVKKWDEKVGAMGEKIIGEIGVPFDSRFASIRRQETNVGNFVCDIVRSYTHADFVLLNSGTFRADAIQNAGPYRLKDLQILLPAENPIVTRYFTGQQVLDALENGVSMYPNLEGRFPQVSGIEFAFDPEKPPGHRIIEGSVMVCPTDGPKKPLRPEETYYVGLKLYMTNGKDGYTSLTEGKWGMDPDDAVPLPTMPLGPVIPPFPAFVPILRAEVARKFAGTQARVREAADHLLVSLSRNKGRIPLRFGAKPTVTGRITIVGKTNTSFPTLDVHVPQYDPRWHVKSPLRSPFPLKPRNVTRKPLLYSLLGFLGVVGAVSLYKGAQASGRSILEELKSKL